MAELILGIGFFINLFIAYKFGEQVGRKNTEIKTLIKAGNYQRKRGAIH